MILLNLISNITKWISNINKWTSNISKWISNITKWISNITKYPIFVHFGLPLIQAGMNTLKVACTSGRKCLYSLVNYF